ncbi:MAG TPA: class I SAM-dependent methyltransferase [Thermoanaerobaculia bacterium]|nr:class I SAM-dependent methyltransferase [Thermoanaerobaculia bacterium]
MSLTTLGLSDELQRYLVSVAVKETATQRRLREVTAELPQARMQISPEQGQLMGLLVRLIGARRVLEVGTFTGYSALSMALALPEAGKVLTCDVSREWTDIARRYWEEAGVSARIDLRLRPALETLEELIAQGEEETFDLAFIDADKPSYGGYYERALRLLRPGGLVLVDNVLWSGKVADPNERDADTEAIRAFNAALSGDPRIVLALVPIGDGLAMALKR